MIRNLVVAGMAASLLAIPSPARAAVTPPANVDVELVTVNGSGCPDQEGRIVPSSRGDSFTVHFSGFRATRATAPVCTFVVQVDAPAGYTYAVAAAPYSGRLNLPSGSSGSLRASYRFTGLDEVGIVRTTNGPRSGRWSSAGGVPTAERVYSPCDAERNLVITTRLVVSGSSSAWMTLDPSFPVRLVWERC